MTIGYAAPMWRVRAAAIRPGKRAEIRSGMASFLAGAARCLDMARRNELTKPEQQRSICLNTPADPDPVIHRELDRQWATETFYKADYSEIRNDFPSIGEDSVDDVEVR